MKLFIHLVLIASLIYPRKLYIEMGSSDELFDSSKSIEAFEYLKELSKDFKEKWVEFTVFEGNHEFYRSDEHIEKLIKDIT